MLSPTINPEYLTAIEGVPAEWLSELAPAVEALVSSYQAVAGAKADIMDDVTKTEPARLLTMDELWSRHVAPRHARAVAALDAINELPTLVHKERQSVFPEPQGQGDIALSSEIRGALKGLDDKARCATLDAMLESGDRKSFAAVVNAPAWLAGISQETQNAYRTKFIATHYPEMEARRVAIVKLVERAGAMRSALSEMRGTMFSTKEERGIMDAAASALKAMRHLN